MKHHKCPTAKEELPVHQQRFSSRVSMWFEDGSFLRFEYAFIEQRKDKIEVYTEHCGYHAFTPASVVELEVKQYGTKFGPPDPWVAK